jgi:ParB family transcriptional regulator, chromosome partitioning protein
VARRSGLGRGLGALIPTEVVGDRTSALVDIPVVAIRANPHQPRSSFDEESLAALTASVREVGVLQPVLVRQTGEGAYELIAGERRWRAAKRAGLPTIPAIVKDVSEHGRVEQALIENLHRQDLGPLEEAGAYQQLIEDFGLTHEQLSVRVGKSRAAITNALRLFQLPPAVQKLIVDNQLTAGHARALLGTPDRAFQEALARRAVAEELSVRAVEDAVKARNELGGASTERVAPGTRLRPPGVLELEELLSSHLDTRVKVHLGAKKGRVTIDFASLEDLERIYRAMTEPPRAE